MRALELRHGIVRCWDRARHDARHAARALRATPLTTLSVVVTLALAIGSIAAMYGLMSALLLQPPPHVTDPARVRRVFFHYEPSGSPPVTTSRWYACATDRLRAEAGTLEQAAAYSRFDVSVGAGATAARARAAVVSAGFWQVLGTRPEIGRLFADDETGPAAGPRFAILGYGFWQQQYGGASDVLGRRLRVRGETFQIVGVTPRGFRGVEPYDVDLWLPLAAYTLSGRSWEPDTSLSHIVRLRPGVGWSQADAELSRVLADVVDEDAGCARTASTVPTARLSVTTGSLAGGLGGDRRWTAEARVSVWLMGIAVALLGVAGANVASLLLVRALQRRREIAVRLALGVSPRRLAGQFAIEGAMLTALGGLAAVAVVTLASAWLNGVLLPNMAVEPAAIGDPGMLILIASCLSGATLVASLAPMLHLPAEPMAALREGGMPAAGRRRVLRALLVAQAALSVVLLVGAGLFVRSLHNVRSLDLGLETDAVLVAAVDFAGAGRPADEIAAFYERALERVGRAPGVERASLAMSIPLRSARAGSIRPAGRADRITGPGGDATYVNYVTPGFFATTGTRVLEGRDFLPHERDGAPVVVVNEATARAGWPGRSAVGACAMLEDQPSCATVVGVVANARRFFVREPTALLFYRPLPRVAGDLDRALFVRVARNDDAVGTAVLRAIQTLEPDLPLVRMQALGDALDPQIRPWRLGATVFSAFGALAIVLATLGLYGALSHTVMERTREIGVRVAVGARTADVVRLVVGDGVRVVLAGVVIGMLIALATGPAVASLLFDVSPRDPVVLAVVAAALVAAALVAAAVPARRATHVDPVVALRRE